MINSPFLFIYPYLFLLSTNDSSSKNKFAYVYLGFITIFPLLLINPHFLFILTPANPSLKLDELSNIGVITISNDLSIYPYLPFTFILAKPSLNSDALSKCKNILLCPLLSIYPNTHLTDFRIFFIYVITQYPSLNLSDTYLNLCFTTIFLFLFINPYLPSISIGRNNSFFCTMLYHLPNNKILILLLSYYLIDYSIPILWCYLILIV